MAGRTLKGSAEDVEDEEEEEEEERGAGGVCDEDEPWALLVGFRFLLGLASVEDATVGGERRTERAVEDQTTRSRRVGKARVARTRQQRMRISVSSASACMAWPGTRAGREGREEGERVFRKRGRRERERKDGRRIAR